MLNVWWRIKLHQYSITLYIFCKIPTKLFTKLTLWWIFHSWELYIFCPFWTFNVAFFPLKTRYLLQITKVVFQGSPSSPIQQRIENTKKLEYKWTNRYKNFWLWGLPTTGCGLGLYCCVSTKIMIKIKSQFSRRAT